MLTQFEISEVIAAFRSSPKGRFHADDAQLADFAVRVLDRVYQVREAMLFVIDPLERVKSLTDDFERGTLMFGPSSEVAKRRWERLQHAMLMADPDGVEETWEAVGHDAAVKVWAGRSTGGSK